jgi:hypothetical protein
MGGNGMTLATLAIWLFMVLMVRIFILADDGDA